VIRLNSADELGANLPFSGLTLKGELAAEMQRGATLDVALMMVGKRVATHGKASTVDLLGDCAGATHIVHWATVGAFAMAPVVDAPHLCNYGDAADCKTQCDRGDPGSCANLALMYDVGTGVKTDTLRAAQLFETACEAGNAPACGRLGEMFLAGSGPAADEGRAREFLRRGCSAGSMPA
jgi:hypothetical protein